MLTIENDENKESSNANVYPYSDANASPNEPLIQEKKESNLYLNNNINYNSNYNTYIPSNYTVYINNDNSHLNNTYEESNRISTSKYNWWNFLPKILIEQFAKIANIYFLIIAIMQSIHEISISGGKPVILFPLSVVVFINGLKDFLEDRKRKFSDDEENRRDIMILNTHTYTFEKKTWADVKLGNIVKVYDNHPFPADLILINSSEQNGMCYIETKNLDGETNLKFRQANGKLAENYRNERSLSMMSGVVVTKAPNEFIYEFDAKLYEQVDHNSAVNNSSSLLDSDFIHIDKNNFLLRGCTLKQTEYIYGLVIYIGHHTKIMKNSPNARSKTSRIENMMNMQIIIIFCLQILLSLCGAAFGIIWYSDNYKELRSYIFPDIPTHPRLALLFFSRIGTWILIFTNLVPISLLVTMEMIKYIQGMFISWDIDLFSNSNKDSSCNKIENGARVQTSTLNEELGQVKFIFSDKTGTLTKNYMEFRMMSVGSHVYGDYDRVGGENHDDIKGNHMNEEISNVLYSEVNNPNKFFTHKSDLLHENNQNIKLFLECISLCHTVITDAKEEAKNGRTLYQASSPDEMCLVNAARYFGYKFKGRDINNNIFLELLGKENQHTGDNLGLEQEIEIDNTNTQNTVKYSLLNILEYSSERKRMSVIVRCPDNKIRLYIKGADSVLRTKISSTHTQLLSVNEEHMQTFAKLGLRTLMLGYREITEIEYTKWNKEYLEIVSDPILKDQYLNQHFDKIEENLFLIGATAIEDQLQDNVADTLEVLMKAGIKIWMLTGDKMDTAKSIAFSCKLVTHEFDVLEIPEKSRRLVIGDMLREKLLQIEKENKQNTGNTQNNSENASNQSKYALIISTDELTRITSDTVLTEFFYELAIRCNAVICCRVTPKQKAQMVNLIKEKEKRNKGITTLAIGDGANDVNMITSAHVGVGIVGVEGTQASRASDYSITEFSHLRKLLLVHGREFYRKNSFVVCYNFYKNVLFVMPQFWFGIISLYSGQTLYDPWIYQLFNIVFASIPIIWFGIYDKEMPDEELNNNPGYYTQGIIGKLFHSMRFWKWVFYGMLQGGIIFTFGFFSMRSGESDGKLQDLWSIGSLIYAGIVVIVNLKVLFTTNTHSLISLGLIIFSITSYWAILAIMSTYFRFENFNHFSMLHSCGYFYLTLLIIILTAFLVDIGVNKLLFYFNIIEDGKAIKPNKIDDHLKETISLTNVKLEEKMKYYGEAFSQDKGQIPLILKKISN